MTVHRYSASDEEIFERIREIQKGRIIGDGVQLSQAVDVYCWVEPQSRSMSVDSEGSVRIYFACVNYGFFSIDVHHELSMHLGHMSLEGLHTGFATQQSPNAYQEGFVNWDFCIVNAKVTDKRDDCVCRWSLGNRPAESSPRLLKLKTL